MRSFDFRLLGNLAAQLSLKCACHLSMFIGGHIFVAREDTCLR